MAEETRALRRGDSARRSQRPRSARRGLHVPERSPGAALRDSGRLRLQLPSRDAPARQPAARSARSGQHPDGDVVRQPHVAGEPRQVHPRDAALDAAAAAAARRPVAQGHERRRTRPVDAGAHGAAPRQPVRARAVTRRWIRSVSRSRISTPSAHGARAANRTSRSTRSARAPGRDASSTGVAGLRQVLLTPPSTRNSCAPWSSKMLIVCAGPRD